MTLILINHHEFIVGKGDSTGTVFSSEPAFLSKF